MSAPALLINGPENAPLTVALAHGAGAPMDSRFMNIVAEALAADGRARVVRFEFPYMRARRESGKRGAPDREPVLMQAWRDLIAELGSANLVIGGKSLGGRIASMVADEARVRGLLCLGYPFHPPGRPEHLRTAHLETLRTPALIIQGTRDTFGPRDEVIKYPLSRRIRVAWIEDGDHSFKPRARSGRTEAQNLAQAISLSNDFLASL